MASKIERTSRMQWKENWAAIKRLFGQAFKSSFHYALATVNENGEPHETPIGSLTIGDAGHGVFLKNSLGS